MFAEKTHIIATTIAWVTGLAETLLLLRLMAKLLAARPDNEVIHLLYRMTNPPVHFLGFLDFHQPRFGAILELSTLALLILLLMVGYLLYSLFARLQKT
jgi:amino acid transporter